MLLFLNTDIDSHMTKVVWVFLICAYTFFIGLIIYAISPSDDFDVRIPLNGEWKISLTDKEEFASPNFDDSPWPSIQLPGSIVHYSLRETGDMKGVCWLRKTVDIRDTGAPLAISLGRIANADETYINGEKIGGMGRFPPNDLSMWNHPRNYPIPDSALRRNGPNTIAVRVHYYAIGEVVGQMMIMDMDHWQRHSHASRFVHITMGYVSMAMGAVLFTFFSLFYARRPALNEYAYYCLQLICGLPIVLEVCSYWNFYPSTFYRLKILGLSWVALNVAHPIFLHRIYHLERKRVEQFLWGYLALCTFICIFFTPESLLRFWGILLIIFTWPIGIYNISVNVTGIMNENRYAKIYFFFGVAVILCAMNDGFVYFSKHTGININMVGYVPSVMVFHIGAIFLYLGTALVLVTRFFNITEQVEALNSSLKNFILENSRLNEKLKEYDIEPKPAQLTDRFEKKLKKVIDHIHHHYQSELSREGLAARIGVHPDNLGKQFKKYTGKKLGDYIYELRVNYAAEMLREHADRNIIDIAFEAGFESLRTFNRVFPKFMEMTPLQYRKIHTRRKKIKKSAIT